MRKTLVTILPWPLLAGTLVCGYFVFSSSSELTGEELYLWIGAGWVLVMGLIFLASAIADLRSDRPYATKPYGPALGWLGLAILVLIGWIVVIPLLAVVGMVENRSPAAKNAPSDTTRS